MTAQLEHEIEDELAHIRATADSTIEDLTVEFENQHARVLEELAELEDLLEKYHFADRVLPILVVAEIFEAARLRLVCL